jgi:hypothetical protein
VAEGALGLDGRRPDAEQKGGRPAQDLGLLHAKLGVLKEDCQRERLEGLLLARAGLWLGLGGLCEQASQLHCWLIAQSRSAVSPLSAVCSQISWKRTSCVALLVSGAVPLLLLLSPPLLSSFDAPVAAHCAAMAASCVQCAKVHSGAE